MDKYPSPEQFWRSARAVRRCREQALAWARRRHAERCAASGGAVPAQGMLDYHLGYWHVDSFRKEMPQIIRDLPAGFRAVEIGAGMGWHAALLAAHGAAQVIATEITWGAKTPYHVENVTSFQRLFQAAPELEKVAAFDFDPAGGNPRIRFASNLHFAGASASALPLPDASVDLVTSWNCIEHVPDPAAFFAEAARVLKVGGYFFSTTEPLYFSPEGHHLWDFFPLPWGHLLWSAEELADLVMREGGAGREWLPGVPLTSGHVVGILREELNYAPPSAIRRALASGPWKIIGWIDHVAPHYADLAREIGLYEALSGVSREALLLSGFRFRLQRHQTAFGLRLPFHLSHRPRHWLRKLRM